VPGGRDRDAIARLITHEANTSQLVDRAHINSFDLDSTDDDELDLLLGDRLELHVDAATGDWKGRVK